MAAAASWVNPDRLLRLLGEQRDLYRRLAHLSERQRLLISDERPELLLNVLTERQSIVIQLARINEQLAPFRQDWPGVYEQLPEDARVAASRLLDEVNDRLQRILHNDREDGALLAARKQMISQSLSSVADGRTVNAAYSVQSAKRRPGSRDMSV